VMLMGQANERRTNIMTRTVEACMEMQSILDIMDTQGESVNLSIALSAAARNVLSAFKMDPVKGKEFVR